jgi:hypothetical protein
LRKLFWEEDFLAEKGFQLSEKEIQSFLKILNQGQKGSYTVTYLREHAKKIQGFRRTFLNQEIPLKKIIRAIIEHPAFKGHEYLRLHPNIPRFFMNPKGMAGASSELIDTKLKKMFGRKPNRRRVK